MRELKPPKPAAVWLTANDIAERLKVSRSAAYAIMRRLPRFQNGRITRVNEADFLVFVHARTLLPGEQGPLELDQQRQKSAEVLAWLEASRRPKATKARRAPVVASERPPQLPPPVDYAAKLAEYEAAQQAALRRLETTPAAQLTGKERNKLRRVLTYAQQVQHGLRKECDWVAEARQRKIVPDLKGD